MFLVTFWQILCICSDTERKGIAFFCRTKLPLFQISYNMFLLLLDFHKNMIAHLDRTDTYCTGFKHENNRFYVSPAGSNGHVPPEAPKVASTSTSSKITQDSLLVGGSSGQHVRNGCVRITFPMSLSNVCQYPSLKVAHTLCCSRDGREGSLACVTSSSRAKCHCANILG